ncbi:lipopolysaccharide-modifying protein [Oceanicola sp. D3]|uniref:glycosyl transferase family 90 n=1 Tax=Oceanicola sp. D3 TaxID=2587163 RepID=UPI00111FA454|nr:glycosyl transferase family 90 [Oceanicola sp. D3]QDC10827.1 lipopolysaccharide-modifying protein [Oceanicola sp. D3]
MLDLKWLDWSRKVKRGVLRQLASVGLEPPALKILRHDEPVGSYDVTLRRAGAGFELALPSQRPPVHPRKRALSHSAAYLCWMMAAPEGVAQISGNTSDGHEPSVAQFSFSSCGQTVPVPDYFFFRSRGHDAMHEAAAQVALPWADRGAEVVWRGRANGLGPLLTDCAAGQPGVNQRLAMALRCRGGEIDFRFIDEPERGEAAALRAQGLLGERLASESWGQRKYAIDIDGITNTWDNLFHRLLLGCCVLKVDSPFGFRQWYYDRLEAGRHFVPVRADLADLEEKLEWLRSHDAEAHEIAQEGQALAREMTWERERARAAEILAAG